MLTCAVLWHAVLCLIRKADLLGSDTAYQDVLHSGICARYVQPITGCKLCSCIFMVQPWMYSHMHTCT